MEAEIAVELGMDNGKVPARICKGRMNCFHTSVQTQNEIVEVESQTKAIRHCYLTPERVEAKLSARLFFV